MWGMGGKPASRPTKPTAVFTAVWGRAELRIRVSGGWIRGTGRVHHRRPFEQGVLGSVLLVITGSRRRDSLRRCLALFAIPLAACADNAPGTSAIVRDSAGIRIVENTTPLWQPGQEWRLSAEPVVDIGSVSAGEEYELFQVWSPVRLSNGSIVVVNGSSQELRFYAERFVQEIKTTANLQHPHILPLFDS